GLPGVQLGVDIDHRQQALRIDVEAYRAIGRRARAGQVGELALERDAVQLIGVGAGDELEVIRVVRVAGGDAVHGIPQRLEAGVGHRVDEDVGGHRAVGGGHELRAARLGVVGPVDAGAD